MGSDSIGERVQRYLLDGSDEDLKRLLAMAGTMREPTARALSRSGITAGWSVLDCGCGPGGALTVLAELTGEEGRVVGVDLNPGAVQRARAVADSVGLGHVRVLTGDVNEADSGALTGPFDVAFARNFLVHQPDPARTLRRMAGQVRPGGWIIAQEALRQPSPRSFPPFDDLDASWRLLVDLMAGLGARPDTAETLPRAAAEAGLDLVRSDGWYTVGPPDQMFPLFASTLAATRERAAAAGLDDGDKIDTLATALTAAAAGGYEWVSSPFMLDFTLRKPETAA